jgi:hypothetical protein
LPLHFPELEVVGLQLERKPVREITGVDRGLWELIFGGRRKLEAGMEA